MNSPAILQLLSERGFIRMLRRHMFLVFEETAAPGGNLRRQSLNYLLPCPFWLNIYLWDKHVGVAVLYSW